MGKAVLVRYCGGCNPRYDRVAAVDTLRQQFPQADFLPEHPHPAATVLVCGCPVQCIARHSAPDALVLTCPEDLPRIIKALSALLTPNE